MHNTGLATLYKVCSDFSILNMLSSCVPLANLKSQAAYEGRALTLESLSEYSEFHAER